MQNIPLMSLYPEIHNHNNLIYIQKAEYIPPEYNEIPELLDELVEYVNTTDDHPLIIAAIVHYQIITIHAFEDGHQLY